MISAKFLNHEPFKRIFLGKGSVNDFLMFFGQYGLTVPWIFLHIVRFIPLFIFLTVFLFPTIKVPKIFYVVSRFI